MTKEEIKQLPPPIKRTIAHAYKDLGFSHRKIAEILGVNPKTVLRYQHKKLDEEWGQFATTIKKIYLEQDFELAQLAYKEMKQKIGRARFFELVGLYKTVRELQEPKQPMIKQEIKSEEMKVSFISYAPDKTSPEPVSDSD